MRGPATRAKPDPTSPASIAMAQSRVLAWLMALLLVLGTVALYWPATLCGFVNLDDSVTVAEDVHVQSGLTWASIKWALFTPINGAWTPVAEWSHILVSQMFGMSPWGHHLVNVLLHAFNAALVFAWLLQMTGARWRSLWVAALFAVHPLRVEAVAWVTERREVLGACFGLLALMAYVRYAQGRSQNTEYGVQSAKSGKALHASDFMVHDPAFYLLSLFFLAMGLMTKLTLVTWPLVMLLLDYWPLGRLDLSTLQGLRSTLWRLVREKIPFFVLVALASVMLLVVLEHQGGLAQGKVLPLGARVANALISYCRYLGKLFWPMDLAVFYPHPGHWPLGKEVLAGGLILGSIILVWARRERVPYLLVGWLWYCGTLVPMSQVIQAGAHAIADRSTYLPSLGLLILAVWGACELTRGGRYQVVTWSVAGGAVIVLCLALTRQQIGCWKNGETLFRHALEVTESNAVAHEGLGLALSEKGQIDEAIQQFQEALRLYPDYAGAHRGLGVAFYQRNRADEAVCQFQEALRLEPDQVEAHNNLGMVLAMKGLTDEAINEFQQAIRLKPDYADARYNLGTALEKKGQRDEALRQFQEAIRLKPEHVEAHCNYGILLARQGQIEEALRQFQEAVRLRPDYAHARYNLGIAFAATGQTTEAIRQFQEALRLKPDYVEARKKLDLLLAPRVRSSQPSSASPPP